MLRVSHAKVNIHANRKRVYRVEVTWIQIQLTVQCEVPGFSRRFDRYDVSVIY